MSNDKLPDVKVGDWVRFYYAGELTIAAVCYLGTRKTGLTTKPGVLTDKHGSVDLDQVIEVRRHPNGTQ